MNPPDPMAVGLDRTRSAVLNILIVVGLGIAVSGWVLRPRVPGAAHWSVVTARRVALSGLLALVVASYAIRRIGSSREALRDPETRLARFHRAHLLGASIAALAVPLGFAYGYTVDPSLPAVAPFWVAALTLGFLSIPRRSTLDDFDAPLPLEPVEPRP
ncbi:MAG: hypothetical protein ABI353_09885 [Isosphaeraceae bacterium]